MLRQVEAPLIGVVLNEGDEDEAGSGGQGYYAYAYQPTTPRKRIRGSRRGAEASPAEPVDA